MKKELRIVYFNDSDVGHWPHMFPYYTKVGGLVFVHNEKDKQRLENEYQGINITSNIEDVVNYAPNIVMYTDYIPLVKGDVKNVQIFHSIEVKGYFAGKHTWSTCEQYDLCLLYGDVMRKEFEDNDWNINYEIIGYPRFDITVPTEHPFDNDKKTVLVAPTWSNESLLHKFTDAVIELTKKYNVILKPHSRTMTGYDNNKTNMIKLLDEVKTNKSLKIFYNSDLLMFMPHADIMVTDYSGASCEFMAFDKPVVIAEPDAKPIMAKKIPDLWDAFIVCREPENLTVYVDGQLENDNKKESRNKIFKHFVYNEEGSTATERGIKAMKKLIEE